MLFGLSLLLILVAVALLVLGLGGGSSALLIGSIVSSLLAAVALVIAARQAARRRATAGDRLYTTGPVADHAESPAPAPAFSSLSVFPPAESPADEDRRLVAESATLDDRVFAGGSESYRDPAGTGPDQDDSPGAPSGGVEVDRAEAGRGDSGVDRVESGWAEPDRVAPGRTDPEWVDGDSAASAGSPRVYSTDDSRSAGRSDFSPSETILDRPSAESDPDYDRASSAINAARSSQAADGTWRADRVAEGMPAPSHASYADEPLILDDLDYADQAGGARPGGPLTSDARAARAHLSTPDDHSAPADRSAPDDRLTPADRSTPGDPSLAGDSSDTDGSVAEFADPDDDDPADEPLPQAVRPDDAVRVARLDDEVLVVDGRPRYHLAECPHLVGRLTESLPAHEAVELGFSPCGLCRPVDRLVARAARS